MKIKRESGQTLIEVLIILALVILLMGGIIHMFAKLVKTGGGDAAQAQAQPSPAAGPNVDDAGTWPVYQGEVKKVEYSAETSYRRQTWFAVFITTSGTQMTAQLGRPAVEGSPACFAMSPDDGKYFDVVVACK